MYLIIYYAKVAFLNHCQTCVNDSQVIECATEFLNSLILGYKSKTLPQPFSDQNDMIRLPVNSHASEGSVVNIMCILRILSKT